MKPNAPSVLERSIHWQLHVAANSKDLRQKERALNAARRLTAELCEALKLERAEQTASATEHEPSATEHESVATNLKENHK